MYLLLQRYKLFIPTCHGYSLISVTDPPTILVSLLTTPQLQVAFEFELFVGGSGSRGGSVAPNMVAPEDPKRNTYFSANTKQFYLNHHPHQLSHLLHSK